MKRFPSWIPALRRLLLVAASAATVLSAVWLEEDMRGERALRRLERECRDAGKPLDYSFYRPAPVPDAKNLFRDPAVLNLGNAASRKPLPWELLKMGGHWQRAQPSNFSGAFAALGKTSPPGASARDAAKLVLGSLRDAAPDLDAVCEAAGRRPYSQAETASDGTFSPNFGVLRYLTQGLTLRAEAEVALGRDDEAFRDSYTVFRLIEGCDNFPSRLHLAMANVMATLALQPFWEGWTRHAWSEAQLRRMQGLISRLHPIRELPLAFAADRAAYAESFARFGSGSGRPWWMPGGWWKLNAARFFGPGGGADDPLAFDPDRETVDPREMDRAQSQLEAIEKSHSPFTWLIRKEAWGHRITRFIGFSKDNFALAQTACALERFRMKSGRYPRSLSEIGPELLPSIPRDVIGGAPLVYSCADGAHFRLYALGWNGVDDHGELPGPTDPPGDYPWTSRRGDWVWPQAPSG